MSASDMAGPPRSFAIGIPDSWVRYDLSGDSLTPIRAGMLRTAPDPRGREQINEAFRNARRILEGARRQGALYAAGTTSLYEDGLLMAGVMVFSVTPPQGETYSARELAKRFSATGKRRRGSGTARTFSTRTLPSVGQVGRLVGVEESELVDGAGYKLLVMHTVIPVPGSSRAMVVTCFSPNLALAEQLYDVFDAITATFAFEEERAAGPQAAG
ncbi:hypothetical protein [Streptomyces yaizuensis]|uniref:Uncharacterized protein n=1 Tax=Streptomyces yaizuensis TaxID=2989713 RepID=A0ABQ5NW98_9ACTN|nr:hypothetical protein [Streptomyces sp. YSPA8]GLF94649.1 hypothetical protein SYYSPA8_10150 [Streptomyces sp. YSPA8]